MDNSCHAIPALFIAGLHDTATNELIYRIIAIVDAFLGFLQK